MTRQIASAEIIAVGSELLTPHRVDTNSLFLTERLNDLGVAVRFKHVVGDDADALAATLRAALARADLVVVTGGLGPTHDDITREAVAGVLGRRLDEHVEVLATIRERFERRGVAMPAINRRQALVLEGSTVLRNVHGTAPGLFLEDRERLLVLLPGPPRELQPMFDDVAAPILRERVDPHRRLRRRVLKITGRSESQIAEMAFPVYSALGSSEVRVETSILAAPGQIELHLWASGTTDPAGIDRALDDGVEKLAVALGPVLFSTDGRSLEAVVGDLLRDRGCRIAVAESCTGGLVLARLTDVPGASGWVVGGVVAYDNAVKVDALGVGVEVIRAHGAVSEPVAEAMAAGVRQRFGTELGVGVTGIAGPSGGSEEKPVGTVVIAVCGPRDGSRRFHFAGDRDMVRGQATAAALDMVRRVLLGLPIAR